MSISSYYEYLKSWLWLCILIIVPIGMAVVLKIISMKKQYRNSNYKKFSNCKDVMKLLNDKGAYGEYLIFRELEKKYQGSYILANVYIPSKEDRTTEIDLIMIHKTGIYAFESKNYSGWIYGQENDKKWTIALNKRTKNQILNPIIQNKVHIKALMNLLELNETYFNSFIVFSERCELKKVQTKTPVMKRGNLLNELGRMIENKDEILNEMQIKDIYDRLHQWCNVPEEVKIKHIEDIKQSIKG